MKAWRISLCSLRGVILCLVLGVVAVFAGEQPKGVIKLYTSWPMQGAMIPEGTAMKRAVDEEKLAGVVNEFKKGFATTDGSSVVRDEHVDAMDEEDIEKESVKVRKPAPKKK